MLYLTETDNSTHLILVFAAHLSPFEVFDFERILQEIYLTVELNIVAEDLCL